MAEEVIGTRIDRGVKRGPKAAKTVLPRSPKADLGSWTIPPDLNPHEVLQRYLTESTTSQIAGQYGLSRKALVKWLRSTVPNEWKEIQLLRSHVNLDDGEDAIGLAGDALSLARAREQVKAAQWRLQALDHDYQPKQQVIVTNEVRLESVIDGESEALLSKIRQIVAPRNDPQVIDLPSDAVQHVDDTVK